MPGAAELVERLELGVQEVMSSDGWRRYLTAQARFHQYSAGNALLVLVQRPDASQVAGYTTWQSLGRQVRKGEKGIAILAPVFPRKDTTTQLGAEEGDRQLAQDSGEGQGGRSPVRFRVAHVFDVSQTEGRELPEPPIYRLEGDSSEARWLLERLLVVAGDEGLKVAMAATDTGHANGFYRPSTREIHVAQGLAPDQQAKTLAHEIAHHMLEHGRGRDLHRPTEEAEAEGVAFVICYRFGLDTSQYSFGYVGAWASQGKDGLATVKAVASTIQRTASGLIERLEPARSKEMEVAGPDRGGPQHVSVAAER